MHLRFGPFGPPRGMVARLEWPQKKTLGSSIFARLVQCVKSLSQICSYLGKAGCHAGVLAHKPKAVQAGERVASDDHMVDKVDIQLFACRLQPFGQLNVFGARRGVAAGVVVY